MAILEESEALLGAAPGEQAAAQEEWEAQQGAVQEEWKVPQGGLGAPTGALLRP